jgi:hypothetical protein
VSGMRPSTVIPRPPSRTSNWSLPLKPPRSPFLLWRRGRCDLGPIGEVRCQSRR